MHFNNDDFDDDFEDSDFDREAFERQRKEEDERLNSHPLFRQANEVLRLLDALLNAVGEQEEVEIYGTALRESAMTVVAKLAAGLQSESYVVCMQAAAIIREHAQTLLLANHLLTYTQATETEYIALFREEMETFRKLFKEWAAEINRMPVDFEDEEWGLFRK